MNTEINGIILMYLLVILMAIPLGKYIGKIFNYEKTWVDNIFDPLDKIFFKLSGVDPLREMNWKQHLTALLTINVVWFVFYVHPHQYEMVATQSGSEPIYVG